MKNALKKLDSKWGMTLAICVTIVISSFATATAATLINGKNIKKGTVASKQIKNGTIVKADLSKKLSVVGPTGPQGVPGAAGATTVVAHRVIEVTANGGTSTASVDCDAGERLVGGGAGFVNASNQYDFPAVIQGSLPTGPDGKPALDGQAPTGWRASGVNNVGATRDFVVTAICAKP